MDPVIASLAGRFRADHDLGHLESDRLFETFAGYCVLSSFYESEFTPDSFRMGEGGDLGIDVFGILVNGELYHDAADVRAAVEQARNLDVRIVVVQAKTSERFDTKVISDLADNLRHVVDPADLPYPSSTGVDRIRECLRAVYDNIGKLAGGLPRLHVRYVTTGARVASMLEQKARSAEKRLLGAERFDAVDIRCVDQRELRELYQRATTATDVTFDMAKKVALGRIPGVEQALLGTVSTRELVEKVLTDPNGTIRRALFRENVRDFLGYTNDANRQIRDTLRDDGRHQRFAVLNNGITIVTRSLTVVGDDVHIRDFQIVNGCQTCYVLFDERERLSDDIQVSLRVVHAEDEDIIDGIVAATNLQTAISEADLSAREDFHRDLEEYFASPDPPRRLYYERRAKQFSGGDVQKTRVITRSMLTAAYASMFLDEPAAAGRPKDLQGRRKKDLFQPGQPRDAYYAAAAALYRLETLIRNERVARRYRPARFHLLMAIRLSLIGAGPLPQQPKKATEKCRRILGVVWDANEFERLVTDLLQPLETVIQAEEAAGGRVDAMVRTQRFADRFRTEVLRRSARVTP